MKPRALASIVTVCLWAASLAGTSAQTLTDITVFGVEEDGNWAGIDIWETRPDGNFNIWIQSGASGGPFLNGPLDAAARPDIALLPGTSSFRLLAAPGADFSRFGINLFFDGASTPSISAFAEMLTLDGPHSFEVNSASATASPLGITLGPLIPAAGTLSFVTGAQQITLTDFYWANQSVFGLDLVGPTSTGSDDSLDYVGGITFSVVTVPEPQGSLWALGAAAGLIAAHRRRRRP